MKNTLHHPRTQITTHRIDRGFTLIELMIVVAVIAILAAIALPSYNSYVIQSRRTDAKNAVLDLASREERFFSVNNAYTNSGTALGYGSAFPVPINASGQSYYSLTVPSVTAAAAASGTTAAVAPGFTGLATPTGAQTADSTCYAYQIDQLGTQTNQDSTGAALTGTGCW